MRYIATHSMLSGTINASPSKSHSLRAILFASMAYGHSKIINYLLSTDTEAMLNACRMLGAQIKVCANYLSIQGTNGKIAVPDNVIDAGNSGQVLRFITAMLALNPNYAVITGDKSIRHNRPMQPLIDGLQELGAFCVATKNDGHAPIIIRGAIKAGIAKLSGKDSQPVSALLIAAAFLAGRTEIYVADPGEKPWIDVTLNWLNKIGVNYKNHNYTHYIIDGNANYPGFNYLVPADFSSILFPVVAALLTNSAITIQQVDMSDIQGDKQVIEILKTMGANIEYDASQHSLQIKNTAKLTGKTIDVNDFIDAVPILAVVGCCAAGETKLTNAAIARTKECDRLAAITTELKKMGAKIQEAPGSLIIKPAKLSAATVNTYNDHRMVMALTVAGMIATGKTIINNVVTVNKSYPDFYKDMRKLGANVEVIT